MGGPGIATARRTRRRILAGVLVLAALVGSTAIAPAAADGAAPLRVEVLSPVDPAECDRTAEQPCALASDAPARAVLAADGEVHAYRFFAQDGGARARLELTDAPSGARVRLLDWGARTLAEATVAAGRPTTIDAELRAAGAYVVEVAAGDAPSAGPYSLAVDLQYRSPVPRAVMLAPPTLESNAPRGAVEGRYTLRTARGGSPDAGVALARGLRTSPEADLGDFALVADLHFEQADGPAAATVRFRYQPEAGGGTGYLVSVDPFGGEITVSTFDEGQRTPLAPPVVHPLAKVEGGPLRLGVRADGPRLSVSIDGQDIVAVTDERYASGLIALGVVTWSGPVIATFDNVQVTVPAP